MLQAVLAVQEQLYDLAGRTLTSSPSASRLLSYPQCTSEEQVLHDLIGSCACKVDRAAQPPCCRLC